MKKITLSLAMVVFSGVFLAACLPKQQAVQTPAPTTMPATTESTPDAMMETRPAGSGEDFGPAGEAINVRTIEMEAGAFYYKPNSITVKKGEKIKLVMKSVDMMHDFNIDELDVKTPIVKSGDTATVEFTADKVGTFEYYCSVGQHKANGQVGTLVVTE